MFVGSIISTLIFIFDLVGISSYQWGLNMISFPLGILFSIFLDKIKFTKNTIVVFFTLLISIIISYFFIIDFSKQKIALIVLFISHTSLGLLIISSIVYYRYMNNILIKLGEYSYEIYLLQGYLIINILKDNSNNKFVRLLVFSITIFLMALLLKLIVKFITKIINNKI